MTFILATNNPNKAREIRALFSCRDIEVLSLADLGLHFVPGEDGTTFEENAVQKARETAEYVNRSDVFILADDSGLEVDALNGAPGVDSALYLGADTPYTVRNHHIIQLLSGVPDEKRTARFVCVAACVLPNGETVTAKAACEGRIADEPKGDKGFGYDPIFLLPERGLTTAELSMAEKNAVSHRGQAMRALVQKLMRSIHENFSHQRYPR